MSDATQIIAPHDLEYSDFKRRFRCGCGVEFSDLAKKFVRPEWAAHVLAVLSETHAVVELPERTEVQYGVEATTDAPRQVYVTGGMTSAKSFVNALIGDTDPAIVTRTVVYGPWTTVAEATR